MTALRIALVALLLLAIGMAWAQDAEIVISRDAAPSSAGFTLTLVASGFNRPLYVTHAGDGSNRLFLVEQSGKIWIFKDGEQLPQPFLDLSAIISRSALGSGFTEQGLLGLAFHPLYAVNGTFYVNYTDRNGSTVVARYQVSPNNPDLAAGGSGEIIFHLAQPYANHNGGHIAFGPGRLPLYRAGRWRLSQ